MELRVKILLKSMELRGKVVELRLNSMELSLNSMELRSISTLNSMELSPENA